MPVNDYSTTPGSNTTINGINIAENCPPDTLNNAIRQAMADIATWRAGSSPTTLFTGGGTFGGATGYTFTPAVTFTAAPVFTDASGTRTALGATTVGGNLLTLANPGAVRYLRINADNTVSARTAAELASDIGVGTGTVTSVAMTVPSGFAVSGSPITSSGTLAITVSSASTARSTLGAAASGANTDITSLAESTTVSTTGTAAADTLGYRGIPIVTTTGKTLDLDDQGKDVYTSGNITIPANGSVAFPVGAVLSITNSSGSTVTISITTDTLRWNASTGTRTLAAYGTATIHKKTSTLWFIKGDVS